MSLPSWPTVFPDPRIEYSFDVETNIIRTEMDAGKIRTRRRFRGGAYRIAVAWHFTDLQMKAFNYFFDTELAGGSLQFYADLYSGGGGATHLVRFIGGYRAQYQPVSHWQISAELEVEEIEKDTEESFYEGLYLGADISGLLGLTGTIMERYYTESWT